MHLAYYCKFGWPNGYSRAAHDYLLALHRHTDVTISICPIDGKTMGHLESRYLELEQLIDNGHQTADVAIIHDRPGGLIAHRRPNARKVVAMTTWETSNFPFDLEFGRYDAVIVPSRFSASAMQMTPPVMVLPHCFDPDWLKPPEAKPQSGRYRFYTIGNWSERKNLQGVIKAYLYAFHASDPVSLHVHSFGCDAIEAKDIVENRSGITDIPSIRITNTFLSGDALLALHKENDCYVSTSRGEGFNLGAFEAAAMGNYGLSTVTGELEYLCVSQNWKRIPAQQTPAFAGSAVYVARSGQARSRLSIPPGATCKQRWLEPDLIEAARMMRARTINNQPALRSTFEATRAALEKRFSYKAIATQLMAMLDKVMSGGSDESSSSSVGGGSSGV